LNTSRCRLAGYTLIQSKLRLISSVAVALLAFVSFASGQSADSLSAVKKVYVSDFSGGKVAEQLRASVVRHLQKSGRFQVVDKPEAADAVLTGTGQTWVSGYMTTSWRAASANRQPVYGGYLSVEIKGKD
jgi:hypothetical protein